MDDQFPYADEHIGENLEEHQEPIGAPIEEAGGIEGDGEDHEGSDELVDSDYEQEADDIARETRVDLCSQWEGF